MSSEGGSACITVTYRHGAAIPTRNCSAMSYIYIYICSTSNSLLSTNSLLTPYSPYTFYLLKTSTTVTRHGALCHNNLKPHKNQPTNRSTFPPSQKNKQHKTYDYTLPLCDSLIHPKKLPLSQPLPNTDVRLYVLVHFPLYAFAFSAYRKRPTAVPYYTLRCW